MAKNKPKMARVETKSARDRGREREREREVKNSLQSNVLAGKAAPL